MKTAKLTAALAVGAALLFATPASASFSIADFTTSSTLATAGAHSDVTTDLTFSTTSPSGPPLMFPDGNVRDLSVELPDGLVGDPTALPQCAQSAFIQLACPPQSQVGSVAITLLQPNGFAFTPTLPVFNMQPRNPEETGELAFSFAGLITIHLPVSVRTDGDFGLTAIDTGVSRAFGVGRVALTVWGVPGDPSHDSLRFDMSNNPIGPIEAPRVPFFTNPTRCGTPLDFRAEADSYQEVGTFSEAKASLPQLTDCSELDFKPSLQARPTTNLADSPSGLDVDLKLPPNEDPDGRATAQLRKAEVTLPEGLVINPSSANGLGACSPEQIGLKTAVGDARAHFSLASPSCPDASRLGSVEVDTPVLEGPLQGSVYLASPHQNPFGSLLALYLVVEGHGLVVKLAGKVSADPQTGRLTATFDENPQVPFEDLKLSLFKGAFAPLRTPATCGTYTTTSAMTPWSAPEAAAATPSDEYAISRGAGGQSCASSQASLPNAPSFEGGSTDPIAGAYKPFVVNLRRQDGSQQFSSITLTPPPGLLARLAGTATCSDAALATAAAKSGAEEKATPSCPAASAIGSVYASAGAGPDPYNAPGTAYLSGPYKGAPLSLAIVTPATAGPFDLGTIVVRTALQINPETAQVTAVSDPIPTILQGIPLDIRSISIRLDKPNFTRNPTSCDPSRVDGSLLSSAGSTASLQSRFQVGDCNKLRFAPKLKLSLKGATKRSDHPALKAVLSAKEGEAGIARTQVSLPHSEFLAQSHIKTVCTRVQFNAGAGNGSECPQGSIYGKATATTPLLEAPLSGPVYLRSSNNPLPDLVAALHGQIDVDLVGRIDSSGGGIRTTFATVPDAPVTKFVLQMQGGKKGLLENSRNLCRSANRASVQMDGQNGKTADSRPLLQSSCGEGKGAKRHGRR